LESAFFDAVITRKTSFSHGLRTDAASRFEKGTDISATVNVLKRAAKLIIEIAGGEIASEIVDNYPTIKPKTEVAIKWHFIKKLSGKNYHPDAVMDILNSLGFEKLKEGIDELRVAVPYHKPDISLPADLVEEIVRIDGLDNIEIPDSITITPAVDEQYEKEIFREKAANYLVGQGFNEMMTNSITNAAYFSEEELSSMVTMMNSLSAELNILRNSLFETSLEVVAHNLNHKNNSLRLFEFGKAYSTEGAGKYVEAEKLCLVITGNKNEDSWKEKAVATDFYNLKGAVNAVLTLFGLKADAIETIEVPKLDNHIIFKLNNIIIAGAGTVKKNILDKFGIHKNNSLRLFEFGKAYSTEDAGKPASPAGRYAEAEKLCLVITGNKNEDSWREKAIATDFYNLKGAVNAVLTLFGLKADAIETIEVPKLDNHIIFKLNDTIIAGAGTVKKNILDKFGIKQPVYFAGLNWAVISELATSQKNKVKEIPKYPAVQRDLAMIVPKDLIWDEVQKTVEKVKLNKLQDIKLFDIFESEKLGTNKKSIAVNFTFQDEEKTLTDKEIDGWMNKIMSSLEKELLAEIRK